MPAAAPTPAASRRALAPAGRAYQTDTTARSSSSGTADSALIFVATAAPSAAPASGTYSAGRRRARHSSQTDVSRNPASGTSSVASDPCAMRSGENAYSASATTAPTAPVSSRANANTTSPNSSVRTITGSRASSISRHGSFPDSYSSRRPSSVWSPAKPGSSRGWANSTPLAMISLPSGGCSGL